MRARREGLFLVVNGQGKEVLAGLGRLGGDDGGEHRGLAPGRPDRAVGLAGDAAGFEDQLAAAEVHFLALNVEHRIIPFKVERMRNR